MRWLLLACLLTAGCAHPQKVADNLDPALVGWWRPVSLRGKPIQEHEKDESVYVIEPTGKAVLAVRQPMRQYTIFQVVSTQEDQLTTRGAVSGRSTTLPYKIDGDHLTIGEGDAKQEYVRTKKK